MSQTTKTDNHNLPAKLALRRHFLRKYHSGGAARDGALALPITVLDCCQAKGKLWASLRREFEVASYWGVDLNPKKGRLQIDSVRILDQPGWTQNVIDIDTYRSPWKHWFALLRHCRHPVTVFLTLGMVKVGGGNYDRALLPVLGLTLRKLELPNSLGAKLNDLALQHALMAPSAHGLKPVEIMEAPGGKTARYIGIRLES